MSCRWLYRRKPTMSVILLFFTVWLVAKVLRGSPEKLPTSLTLDCGCVCKYTNDGMYSTHTSTRMCRQHALQEKAMQKMIRENRKR